MLEWWTVLERKCSKCIDFLWIVSNFSLHVCTLYCRVWEEWMVFRCLLELEQSHSQWWEGWVLVCVCVRICLCMLCVCVCVCICVHMHVSNFCVKCESSTVVNSAYVHFLLTSNVCRLILCTYTTLFFAANISNVQSWKWSTKTYVCCYMQVTWESVVIESTCI